MYDHFFPNQSSAVCNFYTLNAYLLHTNTSGEPIYKTDLLVLHSIQQGVKCRLKKAFVLRCSQ